MKVVTLLSGGIDSTTLLYYLVLKKRYDVHALTIDYGQRNIREIDDAKFLTECVIRVPHQVIKLPEIFAGALVNNEKEIPHRFVVPNRNSVFLHIAIAYACKIGAKKVFFAANYNDRTVFPDCRSEYVQVTNELLRVSEVDVTVEAPFIYKTKAEIVQLGQELGVPFQHTWSCYEGKSRPCGKCGTCRERAEAFEEANIKDPLEVRK